MSIKIKNALKEATQEFKNDSMPSLDYLIQEETKTRITLFLSTKTLNFFKSVAKVKKVSYQGMIRRLLDFYVAKQQFASA